MPLTPKGYCDFSYWNTAKLGMKAEMPLTPKGYCDYSYTISNSAKSQPWQKCP